MRRLLNCQYWLIDSFTKTPFKGNPASVILIPTQKIDQVSPQSEKDSSLGRFSSFHASNNYLAEWMKQLAPETNSPVTCFFEHVSLASFEEEEEERPPIPSRIPNLFNIRWFTPSTKELELCGHATIAACHVLYHELKVIPLNQTISFQTLHSGMLSAQCISVPSNQDLSRHQPPADENQNLIQLSFPLIEVNPLPVASLDMELLKDAFQIQSEEDILFTGMSMYDLFVVVKPEAFHRIPKTSELDFVNKVGKINTFRGIIITTLGSKHSSSSLLPGDRVLSSSGVSQQYDFELRMFLPRYGINEDYVSGSAFCVAAPYWLTYLHNQKLIPQDQINLLGYQASERGGEVYTTVDRSQKIVNLAGSCTTIIQGNIVA